MKQNLNNSQERVLRALSVNDELTYEDLVDLTGIPYSGITSRVSELIRLGYNIQRMRSGMNTYLRYDEVLPDVEVLAESESRRLTHIDKNRGSKEFDDMKEFLEEMKTSTPKYKIKKKKDLSSDKCGVLLLSDLHFGEIIINDDGEQVYDTDRAVQRMNNLFHKTIDQLETENLDELYIAILGDVVDGDSIYRNHLFFVEKPAIEQVRDATKELSEFIKGVSSVGVRVRVGCVRGNHGITNYNNLEADNWDNVVYDMLSLVFDNNPDVVIDHYSTDYAKVNIVDKQVVLTHGRDIGAQIKTSAGLKTFRGLCNRYRLTDGDLVVCGHLHEFGFEGDQGRYLIRNGALPDASEYALKLNYYGVPTQVFFVIEQGVNYPKIVPLEVI